MKLYLRCQGFGNDDWRLRRASSPLALVCSRHHKEHRRSFNSDTIFDIHIANPKLGFLLYSSYLPRENLSKWQHGWRQVQDQERALPNSSSSYLVSFPCATVYNLFWYEVAYMHYRRIGSRKGLLCSTSDVFVFALLTILFQSSLVLRFVKVS